MKKISLLMMALVVAATMSAETIKVDTLTSTSLGITGASGYGLTTQKTSTSGAQYAALAYGGQKYIQIRVTNSNSGVVSTTTAGYIKSVRIVQNSDKGAKAVEVYGSNKAFTAPSDLYNSVGDKLKSLSDLDASYSFEYNYTYVGFKSASGTAYLDKIIIEWTDTKPGEDPGEWVPDTISVSKARELIDKGDVHSHYVKGVVAGAPFVAKPVLGVWLTDIDNPADSLEGYNMRKGKATTDTYANVDSMARDFGMQDTVLIFAEGLSKFKTLYETTSGYFVETIGKSAAKDAAAIFPYAYGAIYKDTISGVHRYEIVLSKEKDEYDNALHYVIRTANAKGIAGKHSTYPDSSYVDGEGQVSGSITITYVAEGNPNNTYLLNGNFTVGGLLYRFEDAQYALAGYPDPEGEPYKLVDDVPFVPQEGDTITCAQAVSYAKTLGSTTGVKAYVRGFATGFSKIDGRTQQSFYMADDKSATQGIFQAYLCYTQNLDSIIKGDEVLIYGAISYYESKSQAQISKGNIYRIGGSDTKRARDIECVEVPESAISVAEALEIGNALECSAGQTVTTEEEYIVLGYIVDVNRQTSRDSATWYMADEKGVYGDFKAYKCQISNLIDEDDYVYVQGKISKFVSEDGTKTSIEIAKGAGDFVCDPSGIEEVAAKEAFNSKKVLINGQLYIVQDGVLYNAQGVIIR